MSISKVSNAPNRKKTKRGEEASGLAAVGDGLMGGIGDGASMLKGGAGMLAGGALAMGGALNPLQLLN